MTGDDLLALLASPDAGRPLDAIDAGLLAALVATCAAIVLIDARERIIPDICNAVVAALGLVFALRSGADDGLGAAVQGCMALLVFWAFRAVYRWLRGRQGLGLGDVKFLGAAGIWVGLGGLAPLILVACAAALGFLGIAHWRGQRITAGFALPFGPFLVAGLLAVLVARFS